MPPPGDQVIEVFLVDVHSVRSTVAIPGGLLSKAERDRADRYRFDHDRDEFIVGRLGLRLLVAECVDVEPAAVDLVVGEAGHPALRSAPEPPVRFNVSHSRGLVGYALWSRGAVGIDIEAAEHLVDDRGFAEAILALDELDMYRGLPVAERRSFLLRHWTAKEAYLKATLVGLGRSPNSFSIGAWPRRRPLDVVIDGTPWSFHDIDVGSRHVGTLATDIPDATVVPRWWSDAMAERLSKLSNTPNDIPEVR